MTWSVESSIFCRSNIFLAGVALKSRPDKALSLFGAEYVRFMSGSFVSIVATRGGRRRGE